MSTNSFAAGQTDKGRVLVTHAAFSLDASKPSRYRGSNIGLSL